MLFARSYSILMYFGSVAGALAALVSLGAAAPANSLSAVFEVSSEHVIEKQMAMNRGFRDGEGVVELLREEYRYPLEGTRRGSRRQGPRWRGVARRGPGRRGLARPAVEEGPGAFKSDPVALSPNALKKQLEHLIQLQEKQNIQNKHLNS